MRESQFAIRLTAFVRCEAMEILLRCICSVDTYYCAHLILNNAVAV